MQAYLFKCGDLNKQPESVNKELFLCFNACLLGNDREDLYKSLQVINQVGIFYLKSEELRILNESFTDKLLRNQPQDIPRSSGGEASLGETSIQQLEQNYQSQISTLNANFQELSDEYQKLSEEYLKLKSENEKLRQHQQALPTTTQQQLQQNTAQQPQQSSKTQTQPLQKPQGSPVNMNSNSTSSPAPTATPTIIYENEDMVKVVASSRQAFMDWWRTNQTTPPFKGLIADKIHGEDNAFLLRMPSVAINQKVNIETHFKKHSISIIMPS